MKTKNTLLAALLFSITFYCCKKGETGPAGPAGPQGPQGSQGSTGSANVIYSDWLSVSASEWKDTVMTNIPRAQRVIKTASALTQQILDSGVILAYLKDVANNIYPLPFTYNINPARVHGFVPNIGKFTFYEYATDGTGGVPSTTNRYRYILIPGGTKTGGRLVDWSKFSYMEICRFLRIPE